MKILDCSRNRLGNKGASHLLQCIHKLGQLRIRECQISPQQSKQLKEESNDTLVYC